MYKKNQLEKKLFPIGFHTNRPFQGIISFDGQDELTVEIFDYSDYRLAYKYKHNFPNLIDIYHVSGKSIHL
jgi:hypothetical protein